MHEGLIQLSLIDQLPHFWPIFPFYTSWKHQKTFVFLVISSGYKMGTLAKYGLNCNNTFTVIILMFFSLVSFITYVSSTHRQRHTYIHSYVNTSLVFLDTKLRVLKSLKRYKQIWNILWGVSFGVAMFSRKIQVWYEK